MKIRVQLLWVHYKDVNRLQFRAHQFWLIPLALLKLKSLIFLCQGRCGHGWHAGLRRARGSRRSFAPPGQPLPKHITFLPWCDFYVFCTVRFHFFLDWCWEWIDINQMASFCVLGNTVVGFLLFFFSRIGQRCFSSCCTDRHLAQIFFFWFNLVVEHVLWSGGGHIYLLRASLHSLLFGKLQKDPELEKRFKKCLVFLFGIVMTVRVDLVCNGIWSVSSTQLEVFGNLRSGNVVIELIFSQPNTDKILLSRKTTCHWKPLLRKELPWIPKSCLLAPQKDCRKICHPRGGAWELWHFAVIR